MDIMLIMYLIFLRIILQHSQVAPDVPLQPDEQRDADDTEVIVEPLPYPNTFVIKY